MKKQLINNPLPLIAVASLLFLAVTPILFLGQVSAGTFTQAFVRLDRLKAATATGGRVCAKEASAGTDATVKVTFPTTGGTDYIVNGTAANWTVTTTGLDTGQTAWPGIGTATNVTGKVVTFPSTDLTAGTLYCFNFAAANTLTTSSAGASETTQGNIATYTSTPTLIDQTIYSLSIISDDQVIVSGIVPPSFAFTLSGNTDSFTANLTPTTVVSTTGRTISIVTNAASGWIVWAKDLNSSAGNGALNSVTAANHKIAAINGNAPGTASATLTTTTENYGLATTINTNGSGTIALDAAYDGTGAKAGTIDPAGFRPIATGTTVTNGDIINVIERANSIATTPAASDYTDTITFVGAGRF